MLAHKPTHKGFKTRGAPMGRGVGLKRGRKRLRQWYDKPKPDTWWGLVHLLDAEFSIWVRRRETACVTCGTVNDLQASHYYKRKFFDVRWDERNVHTMCGGCNKRHNTNTRPYYDYMIAQYGEDGLDELRELRDVRRKFTTVELEEMLDELKRQNKRAA